MPSIRRSVLLFSLTTLVLCSGAPMLASERAAELWSSPSALAWSYSSDCYPGVAAISNPGIAPATLRSPHGACNRRESSTGGSARLQTSAGSWTACPEIMAVRAGADRHC